MAKILLAEDDPLIAESVVDALQAAGHTMEWVKDGGECAERLRVYQYDLAILDWNMPVSTGVDVCRAYRANGGNLPIIMLTGRDQDFEKVQGLDAGADDYLTKPFSLVELTARIRAVLRRQTQTTQNVLTVADLALDTATRKVTRSGRSIDLFAKEFALLEFFMRHPDQVFDVNDLLDRVWSSESDASEDAVRQGVSRLRKKLEIDGRKAPITTVVGLGYRLESDAT
jgi:DNA-binding response OmpR family regulator